jgi:Xaa-Pro aminopeptidase
LDLEWGFTYGEGEYLKLKIKNSKLKITPTRGLVDVVRQVKDNEELSKIKKSMQIVEQVFKLVRKEIKKSGITEIKLAQFIQKNGLKMGAENVSFPAIVASGANAAIPHHLPNNKKLKSGESIIIDFGFKYQNYCSDFTRTVFLKTVPKKLEVAYNLTEKAYLESMEFISQTLSLRAKAPERSNLRLKNGLLRRPDKVGTSRNDKAVTGNDVYQKAVDVLAEARLDKYFIHSLGHGTGLEIHELPNLSPGSKDVLANNMVFSIEPGVYFSKVGGIRIEDLVYLNNDKVEKFIKVSTALKDNIL